MNGWLGLAWKVIRDLGPHVALIVFIAFEIVTDIWREGGDRAFEREILGQLAHISTMVEGQREVMLEFYVGERRDDERDAERKDRESPWRGF